MGGERQVLQLKEAFVLQASSVGELSSPGSSHKADVDARQELLCMPVRAPLAQISTRSQMRDRCSRQPVDREQRFRLLITATWLVEPFFRFQMIKLLPRRQFKIRVELRSAQPNQDALIYLSLLQHST